MVGIDGRARRLVAPLIALGLLTAGATAAHAQGTCQSGAFPASQRTAPALHASRTAASGAGVIVHARVDTAASGPAAHLIVENTNPYPVLARFRVAVRGSAGTRTTREVCVTVRSHEYAHGEGGTVLPYAGGIPSDVTVTALRVRELPQSAEVRDPPDPLPRPVEPPPPASEGGARAVAALAEDPFRDPADPPPVVAALLGTLKVAFGVLLSAVGAMLLVPVAAALFLLAFRTPFAVLTGRSRGTRPR